MNIGSNFSNYDLRMSLTTLSNEWLCDVDKNMIDDLDIKYTENCSITMTIPKYTTRNGVTVDYKSFDLFDDNRIITLNDKYKFIIRNISITEGQSNHFKKFTAQSLESTLQRIPVVLKESTIQLCKDNVDVADGFLDVFAQQCVGWTFECSESARKENINGGISVKYRWVSANDNNFLSAIRQVITDTFHVICIFDTFNKILKVYAESELDNHSGLFLDFGNYIKSTSSNANYEQSCTQLKVVSDKTSISSVNLTGSDVVEKFSDRIKSKMSFELKNALANYEVVLEEQNLLFVTKKNELAVVNKSISDKNIELISLKESLKVLKIKRAEYISKSDNVNLTKNEPLLKKAETDVANKELEIANLELQKKQIELVMSDIGIKLNKETCTNSLGQKIFSKSTLEELFLFTQSETYQNDTALTPYTLMNDAIEELAKRQSGVNEFQIDELTNVFIFNVSRKDGKKWNEALLVGDISTVSDKKGNQVDRRLVGYKLTPPKNENGTSPSLKLTFSDKTFIWNDVKFNSSAKKSQNASNGVFNGKTKWNSYQEGVDTANSLRLNGLDVATSQVTGRGNTNKISIDGYGLMVENTETKVNQVCLINNLLAFTDDGWKTTKTALDTGGLRADVVSGELLIGERLIIQSAKNLFKLDDDGALFKGVGIKVKDDSDKLIFGVDTVTKKLTLNGVFEQYNTANGKKSVDINNNRFNIYDWNYSGDLVGSIYSVMSSYGQYAELDIKSDTGNPMNLSCGSNVGICLSDNGSREKPIWMQDECGYRSRQFYYGYANLNLFGLSFAEGDKLADIGLYSQTDDLWISSRSENSTIIGSIDSNGSSNAIAKFTKDKTTIYSDFIVSGSKNCVQPTKDYGDRLFYATEDCESLLTDTGKAITTEFYNNTSKETTFESVLMIDPIFKQSVDLTDYYVFLTKYGRGDIWIKEQTEDYFIIESEKSIKFNWKIEAHRKGFEKLRLEEFFKVNDEESINKEGSDV